MSTGIFQNIEPQQRFSSVAQVLSCNQETMEDAFITASSTSQCQQRDIQQKENFWFQNPSSTAQEPSFPATCQRRDIQQGINIFDPSITSTVQGSRLRQQCQPRDTQQKGNIFSPTMTSTRFHVPLKSSESSAHQQSGEPLQASIPVASTTQHRDISSQANIPTDSWNPIIAASIPPARTNLTSSTDARTLNSSQIAARHVLPRDLPKFQGSPEEWPMFISSFQNSTVTGGYSNAENLIRLQKCLHGRALEAVRSILLSPENVPNVIETLRMLYGRPDLIIYTLIQRIRDEPVPKMDRLETIINFVLVVRNLSAIIRSTQLDSHMNNPYLMAEITDKLPSTLRLEWSRFKRSVPNATIQSLGDWLYDVAQAASDVVTPAVVNQNKPKQNSNKRNDEVKSKPEHFYVASHKDKVTSSSTGATDNTGPQKCRICRQSCSKIENCKQFQGYSVDQRWTAIKDNKLCSTCFKIHLRFQCRDKKECKMAGCEAWHHTMLHKDQVTVDNTPTSAVHQGFSHSVIYRIIPVVLHGPKSSIKTFAYLDGGSGITLIEEGLVDELGIEGEPSRLNLKWTSKIQRSEPNSKSVGIHVSGVLDKEKYEMHNVRTVKNLDLPEQTISKELVERYTYLQGIPIQTYDKAVSRILIGLENINLMVSLRTVEGKWQEPVATKTRLGWVLQGGPQRLHRKSAFNLPISESQIDSDLHQLVKQFFSIESFGVKAQERVIESKQAERSRQILEKTTIFKDGRSEAGLLWVSDDIRLPDSRAMAMKRLENLERRMVKNSVLAANVKEQLAGYLQKNYIRKLTEEEAKINDGRNWYLPIFPVIDPKKPQKFRLVWDAAAVVSGISLNSNLLTGPDLLVPLPDILQRFREKSIAIGGDIKEMFHQIVVRKEDQNAQRFLWRDGDQSKPVEPYIMQRLTFGATCSPSIAQFIKNKNASRFEDQFPKAANSIIRNHYVDDMIDCQHTVEDAVKLIQEVKFIHKNIGFEIRKFRSNSLEVITLLGEKQDESPVNLCFNQETERILELMNGSRRPTTVFDPLGLLSFFLIYAKILLQDIWSSNVGWDDTIKDIQFAKWTTWIEILPQIEKLQIPRLYSTKLSPNEPKSVEHHVFVDAGEKAYSAVAYLRIEDDFGVECALVGSKTRVAPIKPISIPRLELQAGVLGSRFMTHLATTFSFQVSKRFIWTDSRVLLHWLHSGSRRYRQFVAFRVGEILELTNIDEWRWVPTADNVADEATKWSRKPIMSSTSRWFTGPEFLREDNNWDMDWSSFEYQEVEEEIRFQTSHQELIPPECPDPARFSRWERLQRAQSYVFRVIHNVDTIFKNPMCEPLTSEEILLAEYSLFRRAQFDVFGEELVVIKWNIKNPPNKHRSIDHTSPISQCSPYIDEDGLLRVKGRIDASPGLTLDNRRPIILPRRHRITELLIDWYHRRFHHANHETVINEMKQKFYIPRIRVALKSVVTKCQFCKNKRTRPVIPSMADLPAARVTPHSRVFTFTGVDFFGPLYVTIRRSTVKRYGVLMTCLTTRAIHIEIADGLDTDSCIMALRNFMATRGEPAEIFCDNGTNFHGSENELKLELAKMDPSVMKEKFTTSTMKWYFNPPTASHMGGSWERLIRSVKNSFYHILQNWHPSEQILRNVLKECESIVNSRPLTFVSVDSHESEALTPNHFLLGDSGRLTAPCVFHPKDTVENLNRKWKTSQMLINQFWARWVREYLPTITRRTKWFHDVKPIEVGDVVYIVDETLKRGTWPKGLVTHVFMGNKNQVRSARVKVGSKEYHRPVARCFGCSSGCSRYIAGQ